MKHNVIIEIDGVRHKLIKTRMDDPCKNCSLNDICKKLRDMLCGINVAGTHYRKCKQGE